ncbi:MAG: copper chaperone PCu(A)C [Rhizobiaceae bacterium]|nr:copper chaperone PCu(A)C [Rhizobiaceae bacterium]
MPKNLFVGAALFAVMATTALADGIMLGELKIMHPILRATAPGANVGAGYISITNTGNSADRLVGGAAEFAGKLELHEMKMENQVMKMKPLENGVSIPAGATIKLKPGGNHLMFMKLNTALKEGEEHKATLIFEKAGEKEFTFKVKSIAETLKMKHSH